MDAAGGACIIREGDGMHPAASREESGRGGDRHVEIRTPLRAGRSVVPESLELSSQSDPGEFEQIGPPGLIDLNRVRGLGRLHADQRSSE